jgi:hypothetical protein
MVGHPRQPSKHLLSRPNCPKKLTSPQRRAASATAPLLCQPASPPPRAQQPVFLPLHRASRPLRPSRACGPAAFFTGAASAAPPASFTPVNSTRRRDSILKQQRDIALKAYVASVCFKCFRYFRGMLQLSYADVAKVDWDVAHIIIVVHVCCKLLFSMFHLSFLDVCCKCVYLNVAYVSHICCKCFIWMLRMFYNVF